MVPRGGQGVGGVGRDASSQYEPGAKRQGAIPRAPGRGGRGGGGTPGPLGGGGGGGGGGGMLHHSTSPGRNGRGLFLARGAGGAAHARPTPGYSAPRPRAISMQSIRMPCRRA